VILEHGSRIAATAGAGYGGTIRITTDNFFVFPGGIPAEPDGWLPAPLLPDAEAATTAVAPVPSTLVASFPGPLLTHAACP
jgi:hypothetical protein